MADGNITLFDATTPKAGEGVAITPAAARKVQEILEAEDKKGHGLRVAITAGGCSGFSYGLYLEEAATAEDQVYPAAGFDIFVDPQSAPSLGGSLIDFVDTLEGSGFKIENPNASGSCGCGKSFSA